jgi:hypothetical protein
MALRYLALGTRRQLSARHGGQRQALNHAMAFQRRPTTAHVAASPRMWSPCAAEILARCERVLRLDDPGGSGATGLRVGPTLFVWPVLARWLEVYRDLHLNSATRP